MQARKNPRGFSLMDVVVGIALLLLLFLALFGMLRASLDLSTVAKVRAAAIALAQSQMEYLRGLSYDSLGTVGGIPSGTIAQNATSTIDDVSYGVRTFIEYYDDPADGTGTADTNGITTDYKVGKITVSYQFGGKIGDVSLISDFVPPGIETTTGGGTLEVNVVNATGAGVPDATVQIVDASTSPAINLTTYSDSNGVVYLGGAATSSQYQVYVSKSGYSSAQTYARTTQNPNPNPGYLTVSKNQTTTGTFAIDLLASLALSTLESATTTSFSDSFANGSQLSTSTNATAGGGELALAEGTSTGDALSIAFNPAYLASWGNVSAAISAPASTTASVSLYDGSGNLIPDSALPGNAEGFTSFPVNLSGLSTTTYPSLILGANLGSANQNIPYLSSWSLSATAGPEPVANVALTLTGAKTIGTTSSGAPIYKNIIATSTGSLGTNTLSLEWDAYQLDVSGYDVSDACAPPPYALSPGSSSSATIYVAPATSNSLLVSVADDTGTPISGATVTLSATGYSKNATSSSCGNAYFGAVPAGSYTVGIAKTGYTTTNFPNVAVSGQTYYAAAFP